MDSALQDFTRVLRRHGVRVSTAELVDAATCAAVPGMLATRERFRDAIRACLVTRPADLDTFESAFELFFSLQPMPQARDSNASLDAGELSPGGSPNSDLDDLSLIDGATAAPPIDSASAGQTDMREFFDPDSLTQGSNLDQDADIANLAAMTDEISFAPSGAQSRGSGMKVQLDVSRSHVHEAPGALTPATGQALDLDLSDDEERALLSWLGAGSASAPDEPVPSDDLIAGLLARLPDHLGDHLRKLASRRVIGTLADVRPAVLDSISARERDQLEASLRRISRSLEGGLSQRKKPHHRGTVEPARTARRSLKYDGVPFRPVTVNRPRERPRVVVLADVSLSVRATARFTLHVVHGLQASFGHVRSFAFVDDIVEISGLFANHPIEHALGLVFGGQLLDADASSDYGNVFERFLADHPNAVDRRTSVMVLGDGRSNGKDPGIEAFAEITRKARTTVWLSPEPSHSWKLGSSAMSDYAELSDRVEIVRDLGGLERTSHSLAEQA